MNKGLIFGLLAIPAFIAFGYFLGQNSSSSTLVSRSTGTDESSAIPTGKLSVEPSVQDNRSDDEEKFGGAVVGMMYPEFRDRLINAGFQPETVDRNELCETDPDNFMCDYQFPETKYCSGTGEGYCSYIWSKGIDGFTVTTREHEAGEVVRMSFNR